MPSQKFTTATTATTAPAVNAFEVSHDTRNRWHIVTDTRTGRIVMTFLWEDNATRGPASVRAREYADARWYDELTATPEVAPEPTPDDLALALHLVGELSEMEALSIDGHSDRYDAKSAQVRSLGYEIGPDGQGSYVLMNKGRTQVISATPAPEPLPAYTFIPGSPSSPDELISIALDYRHAVNTGRQWLMVFEERPDLWAAVWATLTADQQDDVLAGAQMAGATPYELSALAGVSLFHDDTPGQVVVAKAA